MNLLDTIKLEYSKYTLNSLIETGLNYSIHANYSNSNPWTLSTYLEWAYSYADNSSNKVMAEEKDLNTICNWIFELQSGHPLTDFKKNNPKKMFHVLAYQQFPYNNDLTLNDFSRQDYLFSYVEFNNEFKKRIGFSVHSFLEYLFKTWSWIESWGFEALCPPKEQKDQFKELISFLNILTIKHLEVNQELAKYKSKMFFKTEEYYSFRPDFFVKYPFIDFNDKLYFIHKQLLIRTIHEYLFNFLTVIDENHKRYFDKRFEDYFAIGFTSLCIPFKKEKDLKLLFPNEEVCDYMIDDYLFSECKAIQMKALAQINPTDDILKSNLELISKAYQQIISSANLINSTEESFGIIFTFHPFYFSDGTDIWDEFLKKNIEDYIKAKNFKLLIPPERLFFIDIKSWDKVLHILNEKKTTLKDILINAKDNNALETTRKFCFDLHLEQFKI